jgi:hypothetical protein
MTMSTNPTGCGSDNLPLSNFTTADAGKSSGTAYGNMPIGSQVSINDSANLSAIIVGSEGANVQTITYEHHTGPARNSEIYVYGQGPQGSGSGIKLYFVTPNGKHDLSVTSSSLKCHTDIFDDGSEILSITWLPD